VVEKLSYTEGSGAHDGVGLGTADGQPLRRGPREPYDGVRTWTHHLDRGSVEGAHAVEFSKTVAPLQEGVSFRRARPKAFRPRSGPMSIAPESRRDGRPLRNLPAAARAHPASVKPLQMPMPGD
jgi:hypothetical protein